MLAAPSLHPEATPYWNAFNELGRNRPKNKVGGGMAASIDLPDAIDTERIRREGERLGYDGDGLDDFVSILCGLDDEFVRVNSLRIAAQVAADAKARRAG